jgi:hypothetical protein
MQFQVPQFIETEDKIVGPLTLTQFLYLAGGFLLCFALYFVLKFFIWIMVVLIVGAISISFAFIKINGKPFSKILFSAINFYLKPQVYVWQPQNPQIPKTKETLRTTIKIDFVDLIEKIIAGLSLKKTQEQVMTGSTATAQKAQVSFENTKEKYMIFKKITGEKRVARRIDYR